MEAKLASLLARRADRQRQRKGEGEGSDHYWAHLLLAFLIFVFAIRQFVWPQFFSESFVPMPIIPWGVKMSLWISEWMATAILAVLLTLIPPGWVLAWFTYNIHLKVADKVDDWRIRSISKKSPELDDMIDNDDDATTELPRLDLVVSDDASDGDKGPVKCLVGEHPAVGDVVDDDTTNDDDASDNTTDDDATTELPRLDLVAGDDASDDTTDDDDNGEGSPPTPRLGPNGQYALSVGLWMLPWLITALAHEAMVAKMGVNPLLVFTPVLYLFMIGFGAYVKHIDPRLALDKLFVPAMVSVETITVVIGLLLGT